MRIPLNRLLLSVALGSLGQGLTLPYLVVYLHTQRHIAAGVTGLAVGVAAFASFVLSGPFGYFVDKFGPARVLFVGRISTGLATASWAFVHTETQVYLVAILTAVTQSLNWGPQGAFIGRLTDEENRQRYFGISFLFVNLGIGLGGVVGALILLHPSLHAFQSLYLLNAVAWCASGVVVLTIMKYGRAVVVEHHREHGGYARVVRDTRLWWMVLVGLVMVIVGYGSLEIGYPAYVTQVAGLPKSAVGFGFAANSITIVVAQMFVLKRLEGRSRAYTLAGVASLWALSWLVLGATALVPLSAALVLVIVAQGIFGFAETGYMPVLNTVINNLAPEALRGRYNAVAGISWGVGNSLGPALAGLAIAAGAGKVWLLAIVGGCMVAALLATRLHHVLTPEQDGRVTAPGLHPAAEE